MDTIKQLGLFGDDKPIKSKAPKPVQTSMFRDVDTVQFGVTKVTPTMPIPADCTIKLALQSEDTRTAEQKAADLQHEAEARTIPLLQDDKSGILSSTTDWCAYLPGDHKACYRAQGDGWNGVVYSDECTFDNPLDTYQQHDSHLFETMTLNQNTDLANRCAVQLLKSTDGQYRSKAHWHLHRQGLTGPRMSKVEPDNDFSLAKLPTRPYASINRLTEQYGVTNGLRIPVKPGTNGTYAIVLKADLRRALDWLIAARQVTLSLVEPNSIRYTYTDED